MARYQNRIILQNVDMNFVSSEIAKYLTNEGFSIVTHKGQQVWKKGMGILTAPQYIALFFSQNEVVIEAFLRYAILPGVYVGEMGIDGVFGAIPKTALKGRVTAVEQYLYSIIQNQLAMMQQQAAAPVQPPAGGPTPAQ